MKYYIIIFSTFIFLLSCENGEKAFDASGSFEAIETIISSQASGKLMEFKAQEGQILKANQYLGFVDTTQLHLSKLQLNAQIEAVLSRKPDVAAQLASLNEQLKAAEKEQVRVVKLLSQDAATPKQADDVQAQIDVIKGSIRALKTTLINNSESLNKEIKPLQIQIKQIDDQIAKSRILNPIQGAVLTSFAEQYELVGTGQPLYKIADLSEIILRAYVSGDQLAQIKLNQKVKVSSDDGKGAYTESEGMITWISDKAEFTPKTVQTKDERANKVYAIKVRLKNDGQYKIGMYGEINF